MTDHHVDDLLKDLDAALSIEPSPSLVARVRTEIDRRPVSRGFGLTSWLVLSASGAAAVALSVYVAWPRPVATPVPAGALAAASVAAPVRAPTAPAAPAAPSHVAVARRASAARIVTPAPAPEPEVIISPSMRLGMAQLTDAVKSGRITGASFATGVEQAEPASLAALKFEVPSFKVEDLSPKPPASETTGGDRTGGGGSRDRENAGGR